MTLENISTPGPTITPISRPFWEGLYRNAFLLQRCESCEKSIFYPRAHCPHCFHDELYWYEASGRGKLKTWSVIHRPGNGTWQDVAPYAVGVVELEEGPSLLTHLLVELKELTYQMDVELKITDVNGLRLPFFKKQED